MSELAYLRRYKRIYLASPYSKYAPALDYACDVVCIVAARLMRVGVQVYSPIAHSHTIATRGGLDPLDGPFYVAHNKHEQDLCDLLLVVTMDGWDESDGIKGEFAHAWLMNGKQDVRYIDPDTMQVSAPVQP
jgi:hypothetical protein